jgi:hypothetical protein
VARRTALLRTVVIDTARLDDDKVADLISEYTILFLKGDLSGDWARM